MAKRDTGKQAKNSAPLSRWARHLPLFERILFVVALLGGLTTVHMMLTASTNFEQDCLFGAFESEAEVSGCQAAFESAVGKPLGVSNAVWGGLFYLTVAALCGVIGLGAQTGGWWLKKARAALIGAGFLYSLFLTVYQFVVLPARCPLCLISALCVAILLGVQAVYLFKPVDLSIVTMNAKTRKREGVFYGAFAALILLLIGADVAYFNSLVAPAVAQPTQQGEGTHPHSSAAGQCFYDAEKAVVDLSTLVDERDPDVGKADASVTVVEIFDPNCPHCKSLHPVMKSVIAQYEDQVRFVYKPIVLPQFQYSALQNAVLFAADEEGKFEEMLDLQFKWQQRGGLTGAQLKELATMIGIDADAMEQRITEGRYNDLLQRGNKQAVDAGVTGVPAVLINGRFITSDSRTEACMTQFLEEALNTSE